MSLADLLEVRTALAVLAARLAAERREAADIERLRAAITSDAFYTHLLSAAGNRLLSIAAQPISSVLDRHVERGRFPTALPNRVRDDHEQILAAVEAGDAAAAGARMLEHMQHLHAVLRSGDEAQPRPARRQRG